MVLTTVLLPTHKTYAVKHKRAFRRVWVSVTRVWDTECHPGAGDLVMPGRWTAPPIVALLT